MLQPLDIKAKSFKKGLFGFKTSDVEDFKESVYKAYDELYTAHEKMSADFEKLSASLQDNRLRMFELENKLAEAENVSSVGSDNSAAKAQADKIIKNAEAAAADIIAKAKAEAKKYENGEAPKAEKKVEPVKVEPVKEEAPKAEPVKEESASSRFFKKAAEEAPAKKPFDDDDDDEIFVGEIEDARKPERMMIGDGEEEEEMDFEFL
ncbi:MAG: DivIVA domain-containing protein [Lachnospiraceae bacterium]|nr:DivIVA domain-containing protein [Lachnospiraceae bacterium]